MRVGLLALAVLIALVGVSGVAIVGLRNTRDESGYAHRRFVIAAERLATAESQYGELDRLLLEAAGRPTAAERTAVLAHGAELLTSSDRAWREYKQVAVGFRGENGLQRRVEQASKLVTDLGTQAVAGTKASPEQLAALRSSIEDQRQAIARLRNHYESGIHRAVIAAQDQSDETERAVLITMVGALVILGILFGTAIWSTWARDRETAARARRNELETHLQRALEMVNDEDACYPVVEQSLRLTVPGVSVELLVADSSRAHFHQVATTDASGGPGCPVGAPMDCPVAARGQTELFPSSAALDACPHLRDRQYGKCSAACVPVGIAGKTVGVVHAVGPDGRVLDRVAVEDLELIARKAGERVGMLRAFARSETQAQTDMLTGLLNRRSLEAHVHELADGDRSYVVAYGDLDQFKQLNDVHGHDAGDRALRLFGRVLRDSVRPNDIPARYGGEEFLVVLPDCSLHDAIAVVERIRERLRAALQSGAGPSFTASFGLAVCEPGSAFSETLELADAALLEAKRAGRDRITVSGSEYTADEDDPLADVRPLAATGGDTDPHIRNHDARVM